MPSGMALILASSLAMGGGREGGGDAGGREGIHVAIGLPVPTYGKRSPALTLQMEEHWPRFALSPHMLVEHIMLPV